MKKFEKKKKMIEDYKQVWKAIFEEEFINESTSRKRILFVCPNCFSIILDHKKSERNILCEECGNVHERDSIQKIAELAFDTAYYGWMYRKAYEKQISENGEISVKYSLVLPSNELIWLASLAIAGIVGGLAYDKFKKVLAKIKPKSAAENTKWQELIDEMGEEELKKFYTYIGEYIRFKTRLRAKKRIKRLFPVKKAKRRIKTKSKRRKK